MVWFNLCSPAPAPALDLAPAPAFAPLLLLLLSLLQLLLLLLLLLLPLLLLLLMPLLLLMILLLLLLLLLLILLPLFLILHLPLHLLLLLLLFDQTPKCHCPLAPPFATMQTMPGDLDPGLQGSVTLHLTYMMVFAMLILHLLRGRPLLGVISGATLDVVDICILEALATMLFCS